MDRIGELESQLERLRNDESPDRERIAAVEGEILQAAVERADRDPARFAEAENDRGGHRSTENLVYAGGNRSAQQSRNDAFRALEIRAGELDSTTGDRLWNLVERDAAGLDSAYIAAVSDPEYERAFAKQLLEAGHPGARSMLGNKEIAAVQRVGAALHMRALAEGEGATGGFAVPFALDPTIIPTSDGVANPLRQLARVTPISTRVWKGIASEGVTAEFAKEGEEAADASPTLAQPEITAQRAQAFVPYSIEVGEDWSSLSGELGGLFAEAKNALEAEKFTTGTGTNEPFGIITGASKVVETATEKVFAVADVYSLQEALPPRHQASATWLASNTYANTIHKFVSTADPDNAPLMSADRASILGKPYSELSEMTTEAAKSGIKPLLYGDIASGFRIVDRIGMRIELIPHLFGENGLPTGSRGLYAIWRTGSKVVNANALRLLKVK